MFLGDILKYKFVEGRRFIKLNDPLFNLAQNEDSNYFVLKLQDNEDKNFFKNKLNEIFIFSTDIFQCSDAIEPEVANNNLLRLIDLRYGIALFEFIEASYPEIISKQNHIPTTEFRLWCLDSSNLDSNTFVEHGSLLSRSSLFSVNIMDYHRKSDRKSIEGLMRPYDFQFTSSEISQRKIDKNYLNKYAFKCFNNNPTGITWYFLQELKNKNQFNGFESQCKLSFETTVNLGNHKQTKFIEVEFVPVVDENDKIVSYKPVVTSLSNSDEFVCKFLNQIEAVLQIKNSPNKLVGFWFHIDIENLNKNNENLSIKISNNSPHNFIEFTGELNPEFTTIDKNQFLTEIVDKQAVSKFRIFDFKTRLTDETILVSDLPLNTVQTPFVNSVVIENSEPANSYKESNLRLNILSSDLEQDGSQNKRSYISFNLANQIKYDFGWYDVVVPTNKEETYNIRISSTNKLQPVTIEELQNSKVHIGKDGARLYLNGRQFFNANNTNFWREIIIVDGDNKINPNLIDQTNFKMLTTEQYNIVQQQLNPNQLTTQPTVKKVEDLKKLNANVGSLVFCLEDKTHYFRNELNAWEPFSANSMLVDGVPNKTIPTNERVVLSKVKYNDLTNSSFAIKIGNNNWILSSTITRPLLNGNNAFNLVNNLNRVEVDSYSISLGTNILNAKLNSISFGKDINGINQNSIYIGNGLISARADAQLKPEIQLGTFNKQITDIGEEIAFNIGNGTTEENRSNLFSINHSGDLIITGQLSFPNLKNGTFFVTTNGFVSTNEYVTKQSLRNEALLNEAIKYSHEVVDGLPIENVYPENILNFVVKS